MTNRVPKKSLLHVDPDFRSLMLRVILRGWTKNVCILLLIFLFEVRYLNLTLNLHIYFSKLLLDKVKVGQELISLLNLLL